MHVTPLPNLRSTMLRETPYERRRMKQVSDFTVIPNSKLTPVKPSTRLLPIDVGSSSSPWLKASGPPPYQTSPHALRLNTFLSKRLVSGQSLQTWSFRPSHSVYPRGQWCYTGTHISSIKAQPSGLISQACHCGCKLQLYFFNPSIISAAVDPGSRSTAMDPCTRPTYPLTSWIILPTDTTSRLFQNLLSG